MSRQPKAYHAACAYLVRFGHLGGDPRVGRMKIAAALRALRAWQPSAAVEARKGMLFISGCFPRNPNIAIRDHAVFQKNEVGR